MSGMQPRRYVTAERSSQKDTHRPSYEPLTLSTHSETNIPSEIPRYGSSTHLLVVPTSSRIKYGEVPRSPSATELKSREQHMKGTIARKRNDGMVSNLKSELQNLKLEVSRIMNKDGDYSKTFSSRDSGVHSACEQYQPGQNMLLGNYGKEISDSVSVTSQKVIDEPLRKLQLECGSENYDHTHYLELENNLLKTELRNLKNKYNATKQQLRQKCDALQKKNQYLEISLRRSQQSLRECRRNLQVEMQTIKFQLSRRLQQQAEQDQIKNQRMNFPQRDTSGSGGNELMQEKMKKLYEQLNEKSRLINNMNLDFNDIKGELERKTFELRKQNQINGELSKQLEFAKRENARNSNLLEQQVSKKMQLTKQVENLRQKVGELSKQNQLKDQIVNNSEHFESKLSNELQNYRENEQRLANQNYELQNELRKIREYTATNQQEIKQLKLTVTNFTGQIEQLLKNVRVEKQRAMEIEQNYRKMIDEIKENDQRELEDLRNQFDRFRQLSTETNFEKEESLKERVGTDIKEKERQISKWKAEYKMLKIKFEEHSALENSKREEIESYYRNYKEYKTKNKVLEMRNKVLEDSANDYISKIQKIQADNLQQRAQYIETINNLNMHCEQLSRRTQSLEIQLKQILEALNGESERANQQENYRKQIQQKVLTLDIEGNQGLMQILEKTKKRVMEQDEKVNKYIKQIKTKDLLINKLRQQIRDMMESQQKELQNFRNKEIGDVVHQIQSKTFASLEEFKSQSKKQIEIELTNNNELLNENSKFKGQIAQLTKQLMELRQEAKSISHLYNIKSSEIEQIRDKHKTQIDGYEQKYEQLEKIKNSKIQILQKEINIKNQQIQAHRNQIKMLNTAMININRETFDQALKNQMEATKKLREELNKKNEEVYRIRDSYALLKAQYDNLKSESDINRLKFISERKNIQVQSEVESQQLKNLLTVEQKKVVSLEQKIKLVIDQNKKKDNFIQTYVMGKKLPTTEREFIAAFLKEYEICVTGKNITEKLQSESQELEKLTIFNFNLMKQIAEMKEKMLLYEAISVDNSEMSKSISDFETPTKKLHSARSNQEGPLTIN